ncbi:branched-chain amino acid ABC transporter permease [Actinocatenispora sera]|jgi:branched-chain amino acid transport system permease protein|uniref:branched-chain amino acid ABC transporter permease n=1 Tax=Actinocatenispora sera TaxID=390989 RepID=UPI0033CBDBD1
MSELLQYVVTGLTTGSAYALVGLGIALIAQVTGVINFAQGQFVMLAGLLFAVLEEHQVPMVLAALAALAVTVLVGLALERLVLPRQAAGRTDQAIMLTIGASIVIEGIAFVTIGTEPKFARPFTGGEALRFGGASMDRQYVWVVGIAALVMLAVWLVLTHTRTGWAMRATAMDPDAARLSGISPSRMSLLVFLAAAALGAIGGIVLAPLQSPDASVGIGLGLKGFAAAVIGGLDRPAGAVAGGLAVGVVEALASGYLPSSQSGFADGIAYAVLLVALIARPTGLLRRVTGERV